MNSKRGMAAQLRMKTPERYVVRGRDEGYGGRDIVPAIFYARLTHGGRRIG